MSPRKNNPPLAAAAGNALVADMPARLAPLLVLTEQPNMLRTIWREYQEEIRALGMGAPMCSAGCCWDVREEIRAFVNLVNILTQSSPTARPYHSPGMCRPCYACGDPFWESDGGSVSDEGNHICRRCEHNYTHCDECGAFSTGDYYFIAPVAGYSYCTPCRDELAEWCEQCDRYYLTDDGHDTSHHGCTCLPHGLELIVPANSHGTIKQDERLHVTLPTGKFDDTCIMAIIRKLWDGQQDIRVLDYYSFDRTVRDIEPIWQTKQGNYTRRLSKALYVNHQVKLEPGLLSQVGSLIKEHVANTSSWYVEFTRDLNQSAEAFYNEGSCWWGSGGEGISRCTLKSWGGFAMRSYQDDEQYTDNPSGRAWVQPLDEFMLPIKDILGAHAYAVYNGYGDLEGYSAARLVAYLASKTYRRISISFSNQYVNGGTGYLVADQETCDRNDHISIDRGHHEVVAA